MLEHLFMEKKKVFLMIDLKNKVKIKNFTNLENALKNVFKFD